MEVVEEKDFSVDDAGRWGGRDLLMASDVSMRSRWDKEEEEGSRSGVRDEEEVLLPR